MRLSLLLEESQLTSDIVAPVPNCDMFFIVMTTMNIAGTAANSYLFLLRIRAVFHQSKLITYVYGLWWLAVVATAVLFPFAVQDAVRIFHRLGILMR